MHDARALQFMLELIGDDHICMGSDYPFPLGEHHPGSLIESMKFSEERKQKILSLNALRWLNLSAENFG